MGIPTKPKIGIYIPKSGGHSVRGIGLYTQNLVASLKAISDSHGVEIVPFSDHGPTDFDLIHYPYFDLFVHSLPVIKKLKTIVSILDVIPLEFPDHYPPGLRGTFNLTLQKISLANVSHILTISQYSKHKINQLLKIPRNKITVTHLAADPNYKKINTGLKSVKSKFNLPEKFVLYVGDINWNKNLNRLTQACVESEIDLVIVGKSATDTSLDMSHPELAHFKLWLAEFENNPHIHRLGFVDKDDLVGIYNLATVYCQPSLSEGFGLSVVEAMACGTPVACSSRASLPEVAGDAAMYFDPEKTEEISKVLTEIISNQKLSKRLSEKGLKQARQFSWNKTAALTMNTYLKLLK